VNDKRNKFISRVEVCANEREKETLEKEGWFACFKQTNFFIV